MKHSYFCMFDVIMLFYISLPSWPNMNTLCTAVDGEMFSVVRADHRVWKSGHPCCMGCLCPSWSSGRGPNDPSRGQGPTLCLWYSFLYTSHKSIMLLLVHIIPSLVLSFLAALSVEASISFVRQREQYRIIKSKVFRVSFSQDVFLGR